MPGRLWIVSECPKERKNGATCTCLYLRVPHAILPPSCARVLWRVSECRSNERMNRHAHDFIETDINSFAPNYYKITELCSQGVIQLWCLHSVLSNLFWLVLKKNLMKSLFLSFLTLNGSLCLCSTPGCCVHSFLSTWVFLALRVNIYVLDECSCAQLTVFYSHWLCGEYQGRIQETLLEHCSPS